jgi:hypothetical protein
MTLATRARLRGLFVLLAAVALYAQVPQPLATFRGTVQEMDGKTLTLEVEGSNPLPFVCTHKTRYYDGNQRIKASDIKPGDHVSIDSKRYPDGELEAINIRLEHQKPS